jgi:DNA-binding Lrp family transcriptional regulator
MGGNVLALDTILSATFCFVSRWSPALKRNQSRDLLRFLLCRLYDNSRGDLGRAQFTLAQGTLVRKLGLSRQWVGELLDRLQATGWIEYYAPVLNDGMRGSTIFRVGGQLKRLLVMLLKSRKRKMPAKSDANKAWQFSPSLAGC